VGHGRSKSLSLEAKVMEKLAFWQAHTSAKKSDHCTAYKPTSSLCQGSNAKQSQEMRKSPYDGAPKAMLELERATHANDHRTARPQGIFA